MVGERARKSGGPRTFLKVAEGILFAAAVILLLFAVLFSLLTNASASNSDAAFFGYKPLHIVSGSMEPAIKTGSIILSERADFSAVKVGDVISYDNGSELITHRVVEINPDGSLTVKGDANPKADQYQVTAGDLKFVLVATMNWTAPVIGVMESPAGAVLLVLLLLDVAQFSVIMLLIRRKKAAVGQEMDERQGKHREKSRHTARSVIAAAAVSVVLCLCVLAVLYAGLLATTPQSQLYLFGLRPVTVQTDILAPDITRNSVLLMRRESADQLADGQVVSYRLADGDGAANSLGRVAGRGDSSVTVYAQSGVVAVPISSINGCMVSQLRALAPLAGAAAHLPPVLLAVILLAVALLLIWLWVFLVRKILAHGKKTAAEGPAQTEAVPGKTKTKKDETRTKKKLNAWELFAFDEDEAPAPPPAAETPAGPEPEPREDALDEAKDEAKVDEYMKQLDELSPDELEDFFAQ